VVAQRPQAAEDELVADEVGREEADGRLHEDSREAAGLLHPGCDRVVPARGQRVVRALSRGAAFPLGMKVAEPGQPLGLGVPLAFREVGVDATLARHPDEVVRACAVAADEDEDDVREGGEAFA
jgi:hypothetical protein